MKKRGQAAFEYMILIGAILVILIPLFYYSNEYSNQHIKIEKAEDAVRTLGKAADSLYALGPGNKDYVWINLPGSIKETSVNGNEILIKVYVYRGESDFYYTTIGPVTGEIPTSKGTFRMEIKVLDTEPDVGVVKIAQP